MSKPYPLLCLFLFFVYPAFCQITASFNVVSTVCAKTPVTIQNTSNNASSYYWSFCAADFSSTPEAVNLGNPNGVFTGQPVFGSYAQDGNGNYYGIVSCYDPGHVVRLNFGNSLLNTPTAVDLGNFGGVIPNQAEGLQLLKVNNKWTAIIVGGAGTVPNSDPRIVKLDFGSSLANTPTATNWGNIGGLNLPHDLNITKEASNYYGFAINVQGNTLTRLNFGPDFTNPPTGVNLGNIGGLNYPDGMTLVNYYSNWYCFIANGNSNSLTRLSFGSSLLNVPVGVNIGNPGSTLSAPRDVSLFVTCDGVYGFVTNFGTNDLVKLNFGTDPLSSPQATNLGNIGNLSFPHSISDFFRAGNDIYSFIPNATGETLTRIRFPGCQDIPGSGLKDPPPVSYANAGVYNINLLVDLGLPTQTSYCQQITVNASPDGKLMGDTVCYGSAPALQFNGKGTAPFNIGYTDGTSSYTLAGLGSQTAVPLPYPLTAPGNTAFELQTVSDAGGCTTTINATTTILIDPLPQGGLSSPPTVCGLDSTVIGFLGSNGTPPYQVQLTDGTNLLIETGVVGASSLKLPLLPAPSTTYTLTDITDKYGCNRTSGFDNAAVTVKALPVPAVSFQSLDPVCISKEPLQITAASETTGTNGTGFYSGSGIDAGGSFSSVQAGIGKHNLRYIYTADDGCADTASSSIVVNPLPVIKGPSLIIACGGIPVQLAITGGISYAWSPAAYLDRPDVPNPTITVDTTTTFIAQVTDSNGCVAADTITIRAAISANTAFVLPNAFTPNGDGHNDCFGIQRWADVTLEQFGIYNRWGMCVFTTDNLSDCWDGNYKGQPMPAGGYVYIIRARTACGEITRKGTLMLVK